MAGGRPHGFLRRRCARHLAMCDVPRAGPCSNRLESLALVRDGHSRGLERDPGGPSFGRPYAAHKFHVHRGPFAGALRECAAMKILAVHNRYREIGGEDFVVRSEADILSSAGHVVMRYERDNREIEQPAFSAAASLALQTIWSRKSYREVSRIARRKKPDVAHFHNTLPLISPSAHWACRRNAVPVVQTLHNYRLLCPAATFLRDGKV